MKRINHFTYNNENTISRFQNVLSPVEMLSVRGGKSDEDDKNKGVDPEEQEDYQKDIWNS